jgi:hypothetical protein
MWRIGLMKRKKYFIILTLIYIALILLFWFFYSITLYTERKPSDIILRGKIYALLTFSAFVLIGMVVTYINKKKNKNGFTIIVNCAAIIICIGLTELFRHIIGTSSETFLWFLIISYFYGWSLPYCF